MALTTVQNQMTAMGNSGASYEFVNRIINGAMVIDQRNAGASVTTVSAYIVDRWNYYTNSGAAKGNCQQNAGAVTPPAGFTNYLGFTSTSAYSVTAGEVFAFRQFIEGYNIADLAWGTANAKAVTLSFWVRSSLTGTFGGTLQNGGQTRAYPFSYTISSANTWEYKTITVAGDTTGTWSTDNSSGMGVLFGLGVGSTYSASAGSWTAGNIWSSTGAQSVVGTNAATWYITGVQLEKGTTASAYDFRDYGRELALCQRYYYKNLSGSGLASLGGQGACSSASALIAHFVYAIPMRASPSFSVSGANIGNGAAGTGIASVGASYIGPNGAQIIINGTSSPFAGGNGGYVYDSGAGTGFVAFSAEL